MFPTYYCPKECVPVYNKFIVLKSHRNEAVPIVPVDLRPLPKEPESEKKKTLKVKVPQRKNNDRSDKPNISYPTNFEHTVHVGFDAVTGEFTESYISQYLYM